MRPPRPPDAGALPPPPERRKGRHHHRMQVATPLPPRNRGDGRAPPLESATKKIEGCGEESQPSLWSPHAATAVTTGGSWPPPPPRETSTAVASSRPGMRASPQGSPVHAGHDTLPPHYARFLQQERGHFYCRGGWGWGRPYSGRPRPQQPSRPYRCHCRGGC